MTIKAIPIIFLLATSFLFSEEWRPRVLQPEIALQKMKKNSRKAIEEHRKKDPLAYEFLDKALPVLDLLTLAQTSPLSISYTVAERLGPREAMEDAHFFQEVTEGFIIGVLDGHGGKEVAEFASSYFIKNFSKTSSLNQGNVHATFEILAHKIQEEIIDRPYFDNIGCTALFCFINKNTHLIYTATIGDSEANIYRKNEEGKIKSIPLSCVRDWSCEKEAKRAAIALEKPEITFLWPRVNNLKTLRYPYPFYGINLSRALGDVGLSKLFEKPAISHKPKITLNQLMPGDILILACDGLKDYVLESEINEQILQNKSELSLASQLADFAIIQKKSLDNVTVLSIQIK